MTRNKGPVEDKPVAESSDSEQEEQQNKSDQETYSDESESESDATNPNNDVEEDETDKGSDGEVGSIPEPKPAPAQTESEFGSEFETDSDSDRPSNFAIKPIHSMQQSPSPLKSNKSPSKRPAEAEAELGLKELKKMKVEDEGVKKASVIQRLFTEDDEIALLEGISEFQAKKGIDPYSNIPKFHEFVKKSIHFDATSNQLKEKIRRLKNKYQAIVKKSGEDPVISKSHDLKVFNLSKKLWGNNVTAEKAKKSAKTNKDSDGGRGITLALASKGEDGVITKKQKKVANGEGAKEAGQGKGNNGGAVSEGDDAEEEDQMVVDEKGGVVEDFLFKFPLCVGGLMEAEGLSEKSKGFWVQNLGLIGKAKLEQYEAELEKIKRAELELFIQKRELINEKLRLLLDSSKSS